MTITRGMWHKSYKYTSADATYVVDNVETAEKYSFKMSFECYMIASTRDFFDGI